MTERIPTTGNVRPSVSHPGYTRARRNSGYKSSMRFHLVLMLHSPVSRNDSSVVTLPFHRFMKAARL
eukprot:6173561-Pleurochrysis_carterae.AAC.3